ncbi:MULTISPECIES: hypothetical protein [Comamonas]|uniref:hypothetical protein n=1 Tax=Comamonas TaxID=283 RepID=UPI0015FE3ACD|nr:MULTISPECIES: hypothetical protein [Comamonas]UUC95340.1 hypothetical protein NOX35_08600 [Comamonas sp. C11]WEE79500.1 hypothetical protein LZ683_09110 [Comamonas testosteroni]
MTLLINLIPLLIAAIGFGLSWKLRKLWVAAATVATLFLYFQAQPSYMPKGQVTRSEPPAFTESEARIEDRNSKPMSGDERDQRMRDAVKQGLDFKQ